MHRCGGTIVVMISFGDSLVGRFPLVIIKACRVEAGAYDTHTRSVLEACCGRTNSLQQHEVIKRPKAALAAGPANGLLEGVTNREIATQTIKDLTPIFLLLNIFERGAPPMIDAKEKIMMRIHHRLMKIHEEQWRGWKR